MKKHFLLSLILICTNIVCAQNSKEFSIAILGDKYVHDTDSILIRLQSEIKSIALLFWFYVLLGVISLAGIVIN
jgi:hypothetical protein